RIAAHDRPDGGIARRLAGRSLGHVDPELVAVRDDAYMTMIDTAEVVAGRYGISRERQDAYALQSQQRTAAAQTAGRFSDEIVAVTATKSVVNRETGETTREIVTLSGDEGNRPDTNIEGLSSLKPAR
ncbi:MAG: acetyl-CoA C-acyltransferase, partial [Albidovulum sp.]